MNSNRNGKILPKNVAVLSDKKIKSKKELHQTRHRTEDSVDAASNLKQSLDFINIFGSFLGIRCGYELKINFRLLCYIGYLIFTWIQIIYSQLKYFADGEHKRILEVFAMYGIAIACWLKLCCFLKHYKQIAALNSFTFKITRLAGKDTAEQLNKKHRSNFAIMKIIALMQMTAGLIFLYNPTTSFIFKHKLVSLLPIEITFVDQTKMSGFLIANLLMTIMGGYAVFGTLFTSLQFYAMILNYSIQVDIIGYDIRQLDGLWGNTARSTLSHRRLLLRNICQKCQDKDNYIAEMKKVFDQTIYFYFAAVYISQIICLYEIEMNSWIPGYGIAYGLFIEMSFHCLFGTKTTIANERLCFILTQSNWYTYDIYSQKQFLILLNSSMNARDLWIGPLAPLSVITGIQIIKSIYTYYTFLAEAV